MREYEAQFLGWPPAEHDSREFLWSVPVARIWTRAFRFLFFVSRLSFGPILPEKSS
jgi:hypothetical protein